MTSISEARTSWIIHGITKKVALSVEGVTPETKEHKSKEFGLTWNTALEAGGWLVGDDVNINIDIELVRSAT